MKNIWLANTHLGLKKILFIYIVYLWFVLSNVHSYMYIVASIAFLFFNIFLLFKLVKNGLYIRYNRFAIRGLTYELRDFISFIDKKQNYREIFCIEKGAYCSKIFPQLKKPWAYFDIIRKIFHQQKKKTVNILILGGGGGSIAYYLLKNYSVQKIDIVEISKQMNELAKKYFLKEFIGRKAINFYRQDASAYVGKSKSSYDFIFVDIFNGYYVPDKFFNKEFFINLKKLMSPDCLLIANLGNKNKKLSVGIKMYRELSASTRIILWKTLILAIVSKRTMYFKDAVRII